jgi:hypothetical protein
MPNRSRINGNGRIISKRIFDRLLQPDIDGIYTKFINIMMIGLQSLLKLHC